MAVSFLQASTISGYSGAISKPSGLSAGVPCTFVCAVAWFYVSGTPSMTGWTLQGFTSDNRVGEMACCSIFTKQVADPSLEASTYTFTPPVGGNDWRGHILAFSGADIVTPVPSGGVTTISDPNFSAPVLPAATVDRNGSISILACSDWNSNTWGSGVSGIPSGFTQIGGTGGEECGTFYTNPAINAGTISATFNIIERYAIVQLVLQPPSSDIPTPTIAYIRA